MLSLCSNLFCYVLLWMLGLEFCKLQFSLTRGILLCCAEKSGGGILEWGGGGILEWEKGRKDLLFPTFPNFSCSWHPRRALNTAASSLGSSFYLLPTFQNQLHGTLLRGDNPRQCSLPRAQTLWYSSSQILNDQQHAGSVRAHVGVSYPWVLSLSFQFQ